MSVWECFPVEPGGGQCLWGEFLGKNVNDASTKNNFLKNTHGIESYQ